MSEIIGTDIKTINIKVPLSVMFDKFGNCVADIKLYGRGTFYFSRNGFGSIEGDIIWKNDSQFIASIKQVDFRGEKMLTTFLQLIEFATNKARLDMNLLYDNNHIERVFIQDNNVRINEVCSLVSDYALSLVKDFPVKDKAINEFLRLVSRLQENGLDLLIPDENKRKVIEKVNSCLLKKKELTKEQGKYDRAITLYLRGQSGDWVDEIWMNKSE